MTRRRLLPALLTIGVAATAVSCKKAEPVRQYKLRGVVVRLVPEHRLAAIKHGAIEGWMEAMTMEFPVRDGAEFAKLAVGLEIEATVNVQDIDFWLSGIRVTGGTAAGAAAAGSGEPKPTDR